MSFGLTLCAGLLSMLALAAPGLAAGHGGSSTCASAQIWTWANAQRPLPTDSRVLAQYPQEQRMDMVALLDPQNRSRLWREHFQAHLDGDKDLTSAQRAVLEDAIALFSPELFGPASDPAVKGLRERDLPALLERASDAFGHDRGIALLTVIGKSVIISGNCKCATPPGDTCGSGRYCDDTADCTPTRLGCGPGGVYACNGMCAAD
jgi:hypothetical protein